MSQALEPPESATRMRMAMNASLQSPLLSHVDRTMHAQTFVFAITTPRSALVTDSIPLKKQKTNRTNSITLSAGACVVQDCVCPYPLRHLGHGLSAEARGDESFPDGHAGVARCRRVNCTLAGVAHLDCADAMSPTDRSCLITAGPAPRKRHRPRQAPLAKTN